MYEALPTGKVNRARCVVAEALFWLHAVIFSMWVLLFFVPRAVWSGRVTFHLYYLVVMVVSEVAAGLALTPTMGKFRIVCPLTTLMPGARRKLA